MIYTVSLLSIIIGVLVFTIVRLSKRVGTQKITIQNLIAKNISLGKIITAQASRIKKDVRKLINEKKNITADDLNSLVFGSSELHTHKNNKSN